MRFTPASDYDTLLKQTNALVSLINSLERQRVHNYNTIVSLKKQLKLIGPEETNSQRKLIEELTNLLEE